jgi:hypothetical protein
MPFRGPTALSDRLGRAVRLGRWIRCLKSEESATGEAARGGDGHRLDEAPAAEPLQVVGRRGKDSPEGSLSNETRNVYENKRVAKI